MSRIASVFEEVHKAGSPEKRIVLTPDFLIRTIFTQEKGSVTYVTNMDAREHGIKDHDRHSKEHWGTEAPCVVYEKKPLKDLKGMWSPDFSTPGSAQQPGPVQLLYTEMVKGVIAGFENASTDRSVVATVFTGTVRLRSAPAGTPRNTPSTYSMRPEEYGGYMELFNNMVDSILMCKKPSSAGSTACASRADRKSETACDITVSSDLAYFRPGGPPARLSSGGRGSDFLPWFLTIETPCGIASAARCGRRNKMYRKGPGLKMRPGSQGRQRQMGAQSQIITDAYVLHLTVVAGHSPVQSVISIKILFHQV